MVNTGRGNVDVFEKSQKGQNSEDSWDALLRVLSGTALWGCHTKLHRARMHIQSLLLQSLCGKAKTIKYFPVTVILQQGFALHHFPFAICFFCLDKKLPWQKGAASWLDLAKGLMEVFISTQLHQQNCLFKEKS